ncbi:MAG: ferrochelatase, partial [Bdellovibrionales bacterium]|nr:ferrochelatase [Bdellovibrionales bacterium]
PYDSILFVSFGGPEGPEDVMPFLENVVRGKPVPRERLLEVAEHYREFGGVSPINEQNREIIASVQVALEKRGIMLPIYFGNRNWKPFLVDALSDMKNDGKKRALAFFTSLFSCYSGCRQYRENIQAAQELVGEGAPVVEKVRMGFNHPLFIDAVAGQAEEALSLLTAEEKARAELVFVAHSIPLAMARNCAYEIQLNEASRLVTEKLGFSRYTFGFQSRSGPPQQPWLEPDILDVLHDLSAQEKDIVVVVPIGFVSDHMEVMNDLDVEAQELAHELGMKMLRAGTPGSHPKFTELVCDLIAERLEAKNSRLAVGNLAASHDVCPANCCTYDPKSFISMAPKAKDPLQTGS